MLESIMYNISKSAVPVIIYLAIIMFIALCIELFTRKIDIHKKLTMIGGMMLGLNNNKIVKTAAILIKTFFIIFCACYHTENIYLYFLIIIIAEAIYMILTLKRFLFEAINTAAQLSLVYIINLIVDYQIEITQDFYVQGVQIVLTAFIIIYAIYFMLKNFEETIAKEEKRVVLGGKASGRRE